MARRTSVGTGYPPLARETTVSEKKKYAEWIPWDETKTIACCKPRALLFKSKC